MMSAGRSTVQALKRMTDPLKRLAMSMISRIVVKSINDTGGLQSIKAAIMADFTKSGMERMQNYGMTSNPPLDGAEGIAVFPAGNGDHGVVIVIDNRKFRLKDLAPGEVALYTDEGDKIHFKRGQIIDVVTKTLNLIATETISITSPQVSCSGAFAAGGNITLLEGSLSLEAFQSAYNSHVHQENGSGGGITNAPTPTI